MVDVMPRIVLGVEYNGAGYFGFQRQKCGVPTIQEALEQAISKVANHPVEIACAGRTDRGVHAFGQVVHFNTDSVRDDLAWTFGVNTYLPGDIKIQWVSTLDDGFDARRTANSRTYQYFIYNAKNACAIFQNNLTWVSKSLDVPAMQKAAQYLVGEHDFSAFRAAGCQAKSPVRRVSHISIAKQGNIVCIQISANAFLHNMVRNIVGALLRIGFAQQMPENMQYILESKCRKNAGITAPPNGLHLVKVEYPIEYQIPYNGASIFGDCFPLD
jgi:tRNA pseudouridine38-40 synthase